MQPQGIAMALWALAHLRESRPRGRWRESSGGGGSGGGGGYQQLLTLHDATLLALTRAAAHSLPNMDPREVCMALDAVCVLRRTVHFLTPPCAPGGSHSDGGGSPRSSPDRLSHSPRQSSQPARFIHRKLLPPAASPTRPPTSDATHRTEPGAAAVRAAAPGRAGAAPREADAAQAAVVDRVAAHVAARCYSPTEAAALLVSLQRLGVQPGPQTMAILTQRLVRHIQAPSPQALCNGVWALARLRYLPGEHWVHKVLRAVLNMARSQPAFYARHYVQVLSALAMWRLHPGQGFLSRLLACAAPELPLMTQGGCVVALHALAVAFRYPATPHVTATLLAGALGPGGPAGGISPQMSVRLLQAMAGLARAWVEATPASRVGGGRDGDGLSSGGAGSQPAERLHAGDAAAWSGARGPGPEPHAQRSERGACLSAAGVQAVAAKVAAKSGCLGVEQVQAALEAASVLSRLMPRLLGRETGLGDLEARLAAQLAGMRGEGGARSQECTAAT
ncbi:MAG: hypothetical protein WDW36_006372 [Sanguina aurantia]